MDDCIEGIENTIQTGHLISETKWHQEEIRCRSPTIYEATS